MNFNIYLNKKTASKVTRAAKGMHRSRNSIITEALEEWLERHATDRWPKKFFDFEPINDLPDFKQLRADLSNNVSEDPLQ